LLIIPLVMIKNAIRIVTLTLLAEHVDVRFLTESWLHRSGGFVFAGIALLLLLGILLMFRAIETRAARRSGLSPVALSQTSRPAPPNGSRGAGRTD
jgi:hypothetical protein